MNTDDFSSESVGEGELTDKSRLRDFAQPRFAAVPFRPAHRHHRPADARHGHRLGALHRTHSVMKLALVGLTQVTPMILLTLPAGHIADNYSRKKIITLMTLVMAASSLGLTLISYYQAPVLLDVRLSVHKRRDADLPNRRERFLSAVAGGSQGFVAGGQLERDHVSIGFDHRARRRRRDHLVGRTSRVSRLRDQHVRPAYFLLHDDANPHASRGGSPGKNVV